MRILIIDYGMSNLASVKRAVEECGVNPIVSSYPKDLTLAEKIILPGVGSFKDGMNNINSRGWTEALLNIVNKYKIPVLGICLGMQLLADIGYEGGVVSGLGLIPGKVTKLNNNKVNERIPHIGWNEINIIRNSPLLQDIPSNADFYFDHSYHFKTKNQNDIIATTPYCGKFSSIIGKKHIYGVQFHPEKSMPLGFKLLKNFIDL